MHCIKNAQGVVTGFHLGEVVDLLKTRVSVFARLDCLCLAQERLQLGFDYFKSYDYCIGLPAKRQLIEASSVFLPCSNLTHTPCSSHTGLPYLSAKAVESIKNVILSPSPLLFLSLAGEYAAQGHLPTHPGKTRTSGESAVPQRWYIIRHNVRHDASY